MDKVKAMDLKKGDCFSTPTLGNDIYRVAGILVGERVTLQVTLYDGGPTFTTSFSKKDTVHLVTTC